MKQTLNPFYAILRDLQVNNVRRPTEFETAVKDKEAAKENIKVCFFLQTIVFRSNQLLN